MPYGIISEGTKRFVEMRAEQNNVSGRINLEPVLCLNGNEGVCAYICGCVTSGIFTVSIIIEGALDEEFEIFAGGFESNIADWIQEYLFSEQVTDYLILVSDNGETVVRIESDG